MFTSHHSAAQQPRRAEAGRGRGFRWKLWNILNNPRYQHNNIQQHYIQQWDNVTMHHTNISFRKENKQIHFCPWWHNFLFLIKVCLCKLRWIECKLRWIEELTFGCYVLDTLQMCAMYTQWKMKIDRKLEDSLREVLTHTITLLPPSRGESLLSIIYSTKIITSILLNSHWHPYRLFHNCFILSTVSTHYSESLLVKCIKYAGCWQPFPVWIMA